MNLKSIYLILIIILLSTLLTGCYDSVGIEETAYAIAIGIDKGTNNRIRLSLQFSIPEGDAAPEPGGGGQSSSTKIISVEAANIDSGINLINSYISKKVNLSHAKVIVISQSLAMERYFRIYIYFSQ